MHTSIVTTLIGLTLAEAAEKLDAQLPSTAYSAVPGGADLTDIDPNYMRLVLNQVFGLCGFGWGYKYHPDNIEYHTEVRETSKGRDRTVIVAIIKHLEFWYRLLEGDIVQSCTIPATGNSENSTHAYALKGALTNAIGNAVSNIGFQQAVYLGQRDHKSVRAGKRPAAQPKTPPPPEPPAETPPPPSAPLPPVVPPPVPTHAHSNGNGQTNGHANGQTNGTSKPSSAPRNGKPVPRTQATPPALTPEPTQPMADGGDHVVAFGTKLRGKPIRTLSSASLQWLANPDGSGMKPTSEEGVQAQIAARKFLATHPMPA